MKRYHADECCKSGWEDAEFYLCSDVDRRAPDPAVELLREAREALYAIATWEHVSADSKQIARGMVESLDAALRGEGST